MGKTVTVSKAGDGDFSTISKAAESVPPENDITIKIHNGLYREKLFLKNRCIRLIGEDPHRTVISWNDGAYNQHADGRKTGTFRSYTLYLGGQRAGLSNLTVQNTAGDGETAGQAVAVYADADFTSMKNVRLVSRQDTLFLAPLPSAPRIAGSFRGPGENSRRKANCNYLKNCYIEGDIDFIFGGAETAFCNCKLFSQCRGKECNGYVAAPCTPKNQPFGFLFYRCELISNCPQSSVYLARPWRRYAMAVFLECSVGKHIAPEGWNLWGPGTGEEKTVRFAEFSNKGPGANPKGRPDWVRQLSRCQAERIISEIRKIAKTK